MAVHIYLTEDSLNGLQPEDWNDAWFNGNVYFVKEIIPEAQSAIKAIDGADYIGEYKAQNPKFGNTPFSLDNISTGCKTAINCLLFPEKIFNCVECGPNALSYILKLKKASIYFPTNLPRLKQDIQNEFILHHRFGTNTYDSYAIMVKEVRDNG